MADPQRPLAGKRVVVTRAAHQAEELARPLSAYGAEVLLCPMLEFTLPADTAPMVEVLRDITSYDFAFLTSSNGGRAVLEICDREGFDVSGTRPEWVVIGLRSRHPIAPRVGLCSYVDDVVDAESFVRAVAPRVVGKRVVIFQGEAADGTLAHGLYRAGAHVTAVQAYRMKLPADAAERVRQVFDAGVPDAVTFGSGVTAANFMMSLDEAGIALPARVVVASLGDRTSHALMKMGHPPQVQAAKPTMQHLASALAGYFARRG